jgi:hypothetical protein
LAACGSPDTGDPSNPVVGAWWRCDGESPDCANLLTDGLLFRSDLTFALIRVVPGNTYGPGAPLCTTTSNNDRGTYTIDTTAMTIDTLNDYGVDGGPVAYSFITAGTYTHVLHAGLRNFIPVVAPNVVGDCM